MSCHVWVYQRVDAIDENTKRTLVEDRIKELEGLWFIKGSKDKVMEKMGRIVHPYTEKDYERKVTTTRRKIDGLKAGGFDYLYRISGLTNHRHSSRSRGKYWLIATNTPFRTYGYPNRGFYKPEPLIAWLKEWSKKHPLEWTNSKGEEVDRYEEELGEQIREYWKSHGNVLYYCFG